jgi:hypothetical protein
MNSGELKALANYMVEQANSFAAYRNKIMDDIELRREVNMGLVVGAVAGSAASVVAMSPAAALGFSVAALVALGNSLRHKIKGAARMDALRECRIPVLTDEVKDMDRPKA